MNSKEIARKAFMLLDEKKAQDIKVIDISKISVIADYFIITGGANERQVKALADNVEEKLGKEGIIPKSIEGYHNANWILMDYGDVIIHIFNQEDRLFSILKGSGRMVRMLVSLICRIKPLSLQNQAVFDNYNHLNDCKLAYENSLERWSFFCPQLCNF